MLSKPIFLIFDGSGRNYFHLKYIKISSIEDPLKDEVVKILRASFTTVLLLEQCLTPLSRSLLCQPCFLYSARVAKIPSLCRRCSGFIDNRR